MTMRSVAYVGTVALLAQVLCTQGCGGGNNSPSTTGGTGGVTNTGGTTTVASTGGTTTATTGSGGTTVTTGIDGSAGTTGATTYDPLCAGLLTAAGLAPSKNGICNDTDPQLCYKTCGPNSIGFKYENCTAGVYVEQSGCSFLPDQDYSCYKIPAAIDASCPTDAPTASAICTVSTCTPCNVNGTYFDTGGNAKTGYCVCPAPSATTGVSKWSCASSAAWPCPAGKGC
jgi:hypothetical protein